MAERPRSSSSEWWRAAAGGAAVGAAAALALSWVARCSRARPVPPRDAEADTDGVRALVSQAIAGAMGAVQLYLGDKLELYATLRALCGADAARYVTVADLAAASGLDARWLREWCAQQAAMGILLLAAGGAPGEGPLRFRLPAAHAEVLADPSSTEYDIALVQMVPALVERARATLPECFRTGVGVPYNDAEISDAIDRHHRKHIRDTFFPVVVPLVETAAGEPLLAALARGIAVAEVGCGGGNLLIALATRYPRCEVHGFEVSDEALTLAAANVAASGCTNICLHDAKAEQLDGTNSFGAAKRAPFDLVLTFDVLHDATAPGEIARQVKAALTPDVGIWLLADINGRDSIEANVRENPAAAMMLSFSICLCMCSALASTDAAGRPNGAGLGTLGFTVPVARALLKEHGFGRVDVVLDGIDNTRWFAATVRAPAPRVVSV